MTRQQRIVNRLIEAAQLATTKKDIEVIMSISSDPEDTIRTWVESTPTTMLTVGVSMSVKAAIDQGLPLFALQELIHHMYEEVRDGKECVDSDTNSEE